MTTFPELKTGAVAQYPLSRVSNVATQAVRFLDGSQQTYQLNGVGLRRWVLTLDLLDEAEVASVLAFAEEAGTDAFSFTDPETGETAAKCIISGGEVDAALVDELNGQIVLEIEEVR